MKKSLTLSVIAVLVANYAWAVTPQDRTGSYFVPISFGQVSPADKRGNLESAMTPGIGIGYNFNNYWAAFTNVNYFVPHDNNTNSNPQGYLWDVDARLNLVNGTSILPYLTAGVGSIKLPTNKFAVVGGLGVDYFIAPRVSLGVNYRAAYQSGAADSFYTAVLTFTFGGAKPMFTQPVVRRVTTVTVNQQTMLARAQQCLKDVLPEGVEQCTGNDVGPGQAGCVTFAGNVMTMHLNVKFLINKANVRQNAAVAVDSLGKFMSEYPNTNAELEGYASDNDGGTAQFNQKLSLQRAQSVKNYLVKNHNIDASRLTTIGMGTQNPIASNATEAGRQLNRRVEAEVPSPCN